MLRPDSLLSFSSASVALAAFLAGSPLELAAQQEPLLTVQIQGTLNDRFVDRTRFELEGELTRDDPFWDVVIRGKFPDPAVVVPDVQIDLDDWIVLNTPYAAYLGAADSFTIGCCIYEDGLCPNCGQLKGQCDNSAPVSPEGIDESFSKELGTGEYLQGNTNLDTKNRSVIYQFNAAFKGGNPPPAGPRTSVGIFSFPRHQAGLPLKPTAQIFSNPDGNIQTTVFDGLVLLKNREGVQPAFNMVEIMRTDGLSFLLLYRFFPPGPAASEFVQSLPAM